MNLQRQHLNEIYQAALASVQGELRTKNVLKRCTLDEPVAVVAIGKAAASMMNGAVAALGAQIEAGLVITKAGYCKDSFSATGFIKGLRCLESGHPVPDERSLDAGLELLSFIEQQPRSHTIIFLISGGTSSLVEVLSEGVVLADLQRVNEWLLASGLDIAVMNQVRSAISCLKSGRLAKYLAGRKILSLMISDVPGDKLHVIGSGLLSPTPPSLQPSLQSGLQKSLPDLPSKLPEWLDRLLQNSEPMPEETDTCFNRIETHVIATINDAKQAAATAARKLGYSVVLHEQVIGGDALATGKKLAHILCDSDPALHIWGGETTVCLPEIPGRGGRNQHLALAAATVLDGQDDCWFLAAGTDGSDGPTDDAGALVDGATLARGLSAGLNAEKTLAAADAGSFLAAVGDLMRTGPTGTNVMDLMIGLKMNSP